MFDLKRFREDKNLNQKELAVILGITRPFVSQIENGKDPMPEAHIAKLKVLYNLDDVSEYVRNIPLKPGTASSASTPVDVMELLREKDRQIDRLLSLLEKK